MRKLIVAALMLVASSSWAAKQIIILDVNGNNPGVIVVHGLWWFTTASPVPRPGFVSQYQNASAAETSALQAGTTIEQPFFLQYSTTYTAVQIKSALVAQYSSMQTALSSIAQPGQYFGVYYDSSTLWSQ